MSNISGRYFMVKYCWTDPINSQWFVYSQNDWTNIGFHNTCVCDSSTNSYFSIIDNVCNGLSITVGNSYTIQRIYSDTLLAFNGCDSIITTNLTVLSISISSVTNNITICDGDSVVVGNNVYYNSGSYTDVLLNSSGCDSTIITNLTVQTPTYQEITICDGDSRKFSLLFIRKLCRYFTFFFFCDSIIYT